MRGFGWILLAAIALQPFQDARAAGCALRRNLVVFVADGLRHGSVTPGDAPTLARLASEGVAFTNSHALFPTFTTPNASAIATGHYLGDTGDVGNFLFLGYRSFESGNFSQPAGSPTPFIEDDRVLADLNDHFEGNYLGEASLLALARAQGCSTAAVGKLGPAAIQDVSQLSAAEHGFNAPQTVILDDSTGTDGVPLPADFARALAEAGLPSRTTERLQSAGSMSVPGTRNANWGQQVYLIDATTRVLLPLFKQRGTPFVLVYWSRDPDGTQHNHGDSFNALVPGINGPTSRAAIRNADHNLELLLQAIRGDPQLAASTDVFVTSDHGFATISKGIIDAAGHRTSSGAAAHAYRTVPRGSLPVGFLAIDLAAELGLPLHDPDQTVKDRFGVAHFREIHPEQGEHPVQGNGLIGGSGSTRVLFDAPVVVAANGGSDLIYVPGGDPALVQRIARFLLTRDYTGALFVDDRYGDVPGTLPFGAIGLTGSGLLPAASLVIGFRTFVLDESQRTVFKDPLLNAVQIADTTLQQGQGMHGSFGRDNTFNFMAAIGPDFRNGYRDLLPVGNADIVPTLAAIAGLSLPARGSATGRVLAEALADGVAPAAVNAAAGQAARPVRGKAEAAQRCIGASAPAADGRRTLLFYQRYAGRSYFDAAELRSARPSEQPGCQ